MIRHILAALVSIGSLGLVTGCEIAPTETTAENSTTQPAVSVEVQSSTSLQQERDAAEQREIHQFGLDY